MRNLMTTVAVMLALGAATPALADGVSIHGYNNGQSHDQSYDGRQNHDDRANGREYGDDDRNFGYGNDDRNFGYGNDDRNFGYGNDDRNFGYGYNTPRRDYGNWERTWRPWAGQHFGNYGMLPRWKLVRRLEAQGFYNVRNLTPGRFGNGWRAFAFYRHSPVIVRLDPFTGRVLAARFI